MRTRALPVMVLGVLTLAAPLAAAAQSPQLPSPVGRVNDFANVLDPSTEAELNGLLQNLEDKNSAEVAVVTVPTLLGLTEDEYASRLFRQWGIGQAKLDNGVLILVAPSERAMRIEVGYGLEGVLPDGLAGETNRTYFVPHFRNGDYQRGILEGTRRVVALVEARHVLTPEELRELEAAAARADDRPPMWLMIPFLGAFISIGGYMLGMGLGSKTGFPVIFGSMFGGFPMIFSLIPFFNAPIWIMGSIWLVMAALGFRAGKKGGGMVEAFRMDSALSKATKGKGWVMGGRTTYSSSSGSSSSWSSGSSSSSSSSSSGSSSSFGGGSSGGGGASSRW